jgi:hypothetical protein
MSDKQKKLHTAIAEFSAKTGMNATTIATITEKVVGLLAAHWDHIYDVALLDENNSQVNVGLRLAIDFGRKCPVGMVTLSFSTRTSDEAEFRVPDPDQPNLPFAAAVGREAPTPPPTASASSPRPRRRAAATSIAVSPA